METDCGWQSTSSFEFNKILDPKGITNTIVATEADRIGVIDGSGIRKLSERECLRLFGYPEEYKTTIPQKELYDLIGNTVTIPVIKAVALLVLGNITDKIESNTKINLETINA